VPAASGPPASAEARRRRLRATLARAALAAAGWRIDYAGLPGPKGILIVYPHTSNWDFVIGILAKWAVDVPIRWVGKESLFRGLTGATLGRVLRHWGGQPVDRDRPQAAVAQLARAMHAENWFWLGLSPEGTRRRCDHLRSGFYRLAIQLEVPVGLGFIDFARKVVGVRQFVRMSGDEGRDLAALRRFYTDKAGRHPQLASTIAFRPRSSGS
jgi:1-acyl-sn-glycerol-3-phosphate acyltransferase